MAIFDLISQQKSLLQDLTNNKTLLSQAKAEGDEESIDILKTELGDIQKSYSSVSERITEAKESDSITDFVGGIVSPETFNE
jgi:hypothetical protein